MEWLDRDFSKDRTILDGVEQHIADRRIAVICGDASVTYEDLLRKAKRVASGLVAAGVKRGDHVILSMERSTDFVCGMLSILYAGAAYVAIDREWPQERLDFIRGDCKAALALDDALFRRLESGEASVPLPDLAEGDEFAIYYTSGSTGKPKGVVTHHGVFLHEEMPVPGNTCSYETAKTCRCVFSMGNFAYGAIACDIVYSLYNGMTLVLATDRERLSPALLGECMQRHGADALLATPSALLRHLEEPVFAAGFAGLKRVILTGEALSERDANAIAGKTEAVLFDAFGASEVRNYSFARIIPGEIVKLGAATDGAVLLVLDEQGEPVEEGELCIGGLPAKYGCYIGHPELTGAKFPETSAFGRIYRTGDCARVLPDGSIRLTGRKDGMVKLHGQRLEPREIEIAMEGFPGVRQAAAGIRGEGAEAVLCAWYTVSTDAISEISEKELRRHLTKFLPAYMVPTCLKRMEELPLNASGKLDRKALPDIRPSASVYMAPDTGISRQLCEAFEQVLHKTPVGIKDNFFLLGGDSIAGMQLVGDLMDRYGISCTMSQLAANPTPAALSQILSEAAGTKETFRAAAEAQKFSPARNYPDSVKELLADSHIETVLPVNGPTFAFLYMKQEGIKDRFNTTRIKIRLESSWKEECFRERVSALVRNHPALRSFFHRDERGKYWQVIRREAKTPLWFKDISHLTPEAAGRFAHGFWQVLEGEEAPFAAACLAGAGQTTLLVQAEHTVADGMSMHVIAYELVAENYRDLPVDGYIAHRQRTLGSREDITPFILDYYGKGSPAFWSVDPMVLGTHGIQTETVALSRQDTDRFLKACASSGILPYSMALYSYGQVILAFSGLSEVWLLALDSGRYAEWGDELRVVGNLISGMPIRIAGNMTVRRFQEDFLRLRECHHLQDSILIYDSKWMGIPEGIVSNDFMELDPAIASLEVLGDDKRRGNSMTFLDDCLTIRLRHADMEPVNGWYQRAARELSLRLKAVSASFGGKGDEE